MVCKMIMCNVSYTWFVVEEEEKQDKSITLAFYNRPLKQTNKKIKGFAPREKKGSGSGLKIRSKQPQMTYKTWHLHDVIIYLTIKQ